MITKVIAVKTFGTMIAKNQLETKSLGWNGFPEFARYCHAAQIKLVTLPEPSIEQVKLGLNQAKIPLVWFDCLFQSNHQGHKNQILLILDHYRILPIQLLVVGSNLHDIEGAIHLGCPSCLVPAYGQISQSSKKCFRFTRIPIP